MGRKPAEGVSIRIRTCGLQAGVLIEQKEVVEEEVRKLPFFLAQNWLLLGVAEEW